MPSRVPPWSPARRWSSSSTRRSLWVKVRFDQGRSGGLAAGLRAEITLRSDPAQPLTGQVVRVESVSDSVTEERLAQVGFDRLPGGAVDRRTGRGHA